MHLTSTTPQLSTSEDEFTMINNNVTSALDFAISPFLLLPDSFGDIYLGEKFSAYVSVVNGIQDSTFQNVLLSIRLQTANQTHELYESSKPSSPSAKVDKAYPTNNGASLSPNSSMDMVVQHALQELGTHTLRVSVTYQDLRTQESKNLRKFYRFNVMSPLSIICTSSEVQGKYMVQTQVTNLTKAVVYIEKVRIHFSPTKIRI